MLPKVWPAVEYLHANTVEIPIYHRPDNALFVPGTAARQGIPSLAAMPFGNSGVR